MDALERVQPALALAARRRGQLVRLEDMAEAAGSSRFHLHRAFRAVAGETPKEYTQRLRLSRAATLLLGRNDSVLRVALDCGFESHEGFTRAFRRYFGMTPSAYRARGLTAGHTSKQLDAHADLVREVGPCAGLYHVTNDRTRKRTPMSYAVETKELATQAVLVERRRVSRADVSATIGEVVSRLFQFAQQGGLALTGMPFTRYLDVGPGMLTIEPGMRVADVDPSEGTDAWDSTEGGEAVVRRDTLPGGRVACTVHVGPYEDLHVAYAAIEAWIGSQGLVPAGAPWESYLTSPVEHPDPKDWKTEVCWPVQPGVAGDAEG